MKRRIDGSCKRLFLGGRGLEIVDVIALGDVVADVNRLGDVHAAGGYDQAQTVVTGGRGDAEIMESPVGLGIPRMSKRKRVICTVNRCGLLPLIRAGIAACGIRTYQHIARINVE